MNVFPAARWLGLIGLVLTVAMGCASAPTQEMSDARQAIQAAREAGAEDHAPQALGSAESLLSRAEQAIGGGSYDQAREDAVASKKDAVKARNIALAIGDAAAVLDEADGLGFAWRDSQKILGRARAAAQAGDEGSAVKFANLAKRQGKAAIEQYYLEAAKVMLWEAEGRQAEMDAAQLGDYRAARTAYRNQEGRKAYELISGVMASLRAGRTDSHVVVRGDSLWAVSAKARIYDDPYQWPLIYKANSSRIRDPDLIYPGQGLTIRRSHSAAEVDAAVRHARTRGAWESGVVEETDLLYIGR